MGNIDDTRRVSRAIDRKLNGEIFKEKVQNAYRSSIYSNINRLGRKRN